MSAGSLLSQLGATATVSMAIAFEGCLIAGAIGLASGRTGVSPVAPPAHRLVRLMAGLAAASAITAATAAAAVHALTDQTASKGFIAIECGLVACALIFLVLLHTWLRGEPST